MHRYGLNVTTVEAAGCHTPKANKLDSKVKEDILKNRIMSRKQQRKTYNKHGESPQEGKAVLPNKEPNHINAYINASISPNDFLEQVQLISSRKPALPSEVSKEASKSNTGTNSHAVQNFNKHSGKETSSNVAQDFVLTGLHACGNLTPTMLRMFVKCENCLGIASVGCCYMKMVTSGSRETSSDTMDFPMSQFYQKNCPFSMNYESLELACHFIDAYHDRLLENSDALKTQCYRAALQEIIMEKDRTFDHASVKVTVKQPEKMSFEEYAAQALKRVGLDPHLSTAQLNRSAQRLADWNGVVALYTIRLALAPAIESLVLRDRVMFLKEHGIQAEILPIFNPRISPRNFVLLAKKKGSCDIEAE